MNYLACRFHSTSVLLIIIFVSGGCMSRYQNSYGEYRPENPKFTLYSDSTIKQFESEEFSIAFAFDTILPSVPGPYYRDVLLFSEDQRFAAIAWLESDQYRDTLVISTDPWLMAHQVGFYTLQNDTLKVEYFTNFQGGQYHIFQGVVSDNGKILRIFEYYQGLRRFKAEMNVPHRSKLWGISQLVVKY